MFARRRNFSSRQEDILAGYDFTYRVRGALIKAREEARLRHHEHVGTEHLLLGLLAEDDTLVMDVLENLGARPVDLQTAVELMITDGKATGRVQTPDLPYTPRARVVLDQAISAAHEFGDGYVGTQHLLLGIIREQHGIAARAMTTAGLTEPQLRREIVRLLQGEGVAAMIEVPQSDTQVPLSIAVEVHYGDGSTAKKVFTSKDEAIVFLRDKPRE
jgi:ATP-dependent Clp protease ATP-binding subunit ClpA